MLKKDGVFSMMDSKYEVIMNDLSNLYINDAGELIHVCEGGETVLCRVSTVCDYDMNQILAQARRTIADCSKKLSEMHAEFRAVSELLKFLENASNGEG